MTYFRNAADLAGILAYLAPYASPAMLAEIDYAEACDEDVTYFAAGEPVAYVFADGAVEVAA